MVFSPTPYSLLPSSGAMSVQLIRQYHTKVAKIIQYSGSHNESALRKPFQDLLEQYARARNLELIAELDYRTPTLSLL